MASKRFIGLVGTVAAAVLLVSGCLLVGEVDELPVAAARAHDVNADGLVVGSHWLPSPPVTDRAYAHDTATGTTTELGTLGGTASVANAVNDSGVIVGWSMTADGKQHAFRYAAATGMVDIGTLDPPGTWAASQAADINSSGVIVGTSITHVFGGNNHAFARDPATGAMTDLGTLGGTSSGATAINDAGVIVGWSQIAGDAETHAFVLEPGGTMTDLGTLGGTESRAEDLNESGVVVGWSTTGGNSCESFGLVCPQYRAFTYDLGTGVRTVLGIVVGTTDARASGINEEGIVVGHAITMEIKCSACPTKTNAVAWEAGTSGVYQVGTDDVASLAAVNDSGRAAGTSGHITSFPVPIVVPYAFTADIELVAD